MNFHDAEALSAYLDGQLSPSDSARLETRLAADEELRRVLADLRLARGVLRKLPHRRAPRNFTLTPLTPRIRGPVPRAVPMLAYASALASIMFVVTLAVNGLAPLAARSLAAPAPAYGIGGGAGEGASATEAPLQSLAAAAPTGTAGSEFASQPADRGAATAGAPTEAAPKLAPPGAATAPIAKSGSPPLVPAVWQIMLAGAALLMGGLGWYLRRQSQRSFRHRWTQK